jgi:hypothetical protein
MMKNKCGKPDNAREGIAKKKERKQNIQDIEYL